MIKFKKIIVLKILMVASLFTLPVALSAFIISSGKSPTVEGTPTYVESGLTKFIKKNNDGGKPSTLHIFPDATNAEINFKDIYNDVSYEETTKTLTLGNIDGSVFEITDNYYFEHSDAASSSKTFDVNSNNPYHLAQHKEGDGNIFNWVNGKEQEFRQYTIKLISDIHLTNNSSIVMSSVLGGFNGGIGSAGPVNADKYVNIDLNGHTLTIDSDCTLYNYGHIYDSKFDENGKHLGMIDCKGTILTPFIVDDYDGGARQFAGTALAETTPFRIFSMPYMSCKVKFSNTSVLRALSSLNASNKLRTANFPFIGENGFITINNNNGSLIKDSYNPYFDSTKKTTQIEFAENYRCFYEFDGDFNFNSIQMSIDIAILKVNVDMSEYSFPIPPYAHVKVKSNSKINVPLLFDFYPGSSLITEENSVINFTTKQYTSVIKNNGNGTSYGGIRCLNQLFPSTATTMISTHANYNSLNYAKYEEEENLLYNKMLYGDQINTRSRIKINSRIEQNGNNHIIAGKINLGRETVSSLQQLNGSFKYFSNDDFNYYYLTQGAGDIIELGQLLKEGTKSLSITGGYLTLPLVSEGKVLFDINSNNVSELLVTDFLYDFNQGIYKNSITGDYKAFMFSNDIKNDLSGNFCNIDSVNYENNYIVYNNVPYKFFRNCFVQSNNLYGKISTEYTEGINLFNNTAIGPIPVNGTKKIKYKNFSQTRNRKMVKPLFGGDWRVESDFIDWDSVPINQSADTSNDLSGEISIKTMCNLSNVVIAGKKYNSFKELYDSGTLITSNLKKFYGDIGVETSTLVGTCDIFSSYDGFNNEQYIYPNGKTEYQNPFIESDIEIGKPNRNHTQRIDTQTRTWTIESSVISSPSGTYSDNINLYHDANEKNIILKYNEKLGYYTK